MKKYLSLFLILTLLLILSACGKSEENSSSNTVDDKKSLKLATCYYSCGTTIHANRQRIRGLRY